MNNNENEGRQLTKDEIRSGKASREEFRKLTRTPIYIVLDGLKSAHNVGTIIRLSDALLVDKVYSHILGYRRDGRTMFFLVKLRVPQDYG